MDYSYDTISPRMNDNTISQPYDIGQLNSYSECYNSFGEAYGMDYGRSGNLYWVETKNEKHDY